MTQPIEPVAKVDAPWPAHMPRVQWLQLSAVKHGDALYTASALEAAKQEGHRQGLEELREYLKKEIEAHHKFKNHQAVYALDCADEHVGALIEGHP